MSEYKKIIAKINNEEFFPIYILVGDENYFADNIIKSLTSKLVTEDSKDFDYFKPGVASCSPNHNLLSWSFDSKGSEFFSIKIKDLKNNKIFHIENNFVG